MIDDPCPSMKSLLDDLVEWAQIQFEDEIVKALCTRYRLCRRIKLDLLGASERGCGTQYIALAEFHRRFPSFPIYLFARRIRDVEKDNPIHRIFMDFENRSFTKAYLALADQLPDGVEIYGLVFHWPHTGDHSGDACERLPALVLHNRPNVPVANRLQFVRRHDERQTLYLEHLSSMLAAIDRESPTGRWRPAKHELKVRRRIIRL